MTVQLKDEIVEALGTLVGIKMKKHSVSRRGDGFLSSYLAALKRLKRLCLDTRIIFGCSKRCDTRITTYGERCFMRKAGNSARSFVSLQTLVSLTVKPYWLKSRRMAAPTSLFDHQPSPWNFAVRTEQTLA